MKFYENQTFIHENFENKNLSDDVFSECKFENCSFQKSIFKNSKLSDCSFKNSYIHLIELEGSHFQNVVFEECKVVAGEFFKCDKKFFSIFFKKSILMGCNFSDLKMKSAEFTDCKIKDCYFNNTFLIKSNFQYSDLQGTIFHHCDLSEADFRNSKNYSINPQSNIIKKIKFSSPEVLSILSFFDIQIS